jgi:uncharacterized protein
MAIRVPDDPVLERFRTSLHSIYGNRLERAVLFGSRLRGDARPDSDYDVAVFLRDMGDRFAEMDRLADLSSDILDEMGEFIHAMPLRAGSYEERTPLMHEIRVGRSMKPESGRVFGTGLAYRVASGRVSVISFEAS